MAQTMTGIVVSAKMQGSVIVEVTRRVPHKLYKKLISVSKRYVAGKNNLEVIEGDEVILKETRKTAGKKHFVIERKVK